MKLADEYNLSPFLFLDRHYTIGYAYNKVLPKAELNGFDWTFVQGSAFVLRLNFCTKSPRLRQYPKRCTQFDQAIFINQFSDSIKQLNFIKTIVRLELKPTSTFTTNFTVEQIVVFRFSIFHYAMCGLLLKSKRKIVDATNLFIKSIKRTDKNCFIKQPTTFANNLKFDGQTATQKLNPSFLLLQV